MNADSGYTRTAIGLHWLIALIIFCSFPLGLYMIDLPLSPTKLRIYSYHKWAGVTVFVLSVLRLAWRLRHPAPPLPASTPAWQAHLAGGFHLTLYVLLLAIPVSGWLMSSALGFQTVWFGVLPLPDLLDKDKVLGEGLKAVHGVLTFGLMAIVAGHAGAALKHHFVDRDDILVRMIPLLGKPEKRP